MSNQVSQRLSLVEHVQRPLSVKAPVFSPFVVKGVLRPSQSQADSAYAGTISE